MRGPRTHRQWLVTGLLAGAVWAVVALAETTGAKVPQGPGWGEISASLVLFACFPLAAWFPITAMVLSVLVVPYIAALGLPGVGGSQLIAQLVLVAHAAFREPPRRTVPAAVVAAVVPAVALRLTGESSWEFVFFAVLGLFGWSVGALLRREQIRSAQLAELAAQLATEREARARAAVDEERARISRELHDAVAHTVSVMTMQAGVLRRRLSDRPVERDALAQVEELGRRSVEEIRRVVGLLRPDDTDGLGPAPSLRRLDELLEHVRAAGLDVRLRVEGEVVSLPAALDMSAYRVVQEALTNVLRHAGARWAEIVVAYRGSEVGLTVTDDGRGTAPGAGRDGAAGGPGGHGLVGMRERVGLFGGELRTGPRAEGGYEVAATFPLSDVRRKPGSARKAETPRDAREARKAETAAGETQAVREVAAGETEAAREPEEAR